MHVYRGTAIIGCLELICAMFLLIETVEFAYYDGKLFFTKFFYGKGMVLAAISLSDCLVMSIAILLLFMGISRKDPK